MNYSSACTFCSTKVSLPSIFILRRCLSCILSIYSSTSKWSDMRPLQMAENKWIYLGLCRPIYSYFTHFGSETPTLYIWDVLSQTLHGPGVFTYTQATFPAFFPAVVRFKSSSDFESLGLYFWPLLFKIDWFILMWFVPQVLAWNHEWLRGNLWKTCGRLVGICCIHVDVSAFRCAENQLIVENMFDKKRFIDTRWCIISFTKRLLLVVSQFLRIGGFKGFFWCCRGTTQKHWGSWKLYDKNDSFRFMNLWRKILFIWYLLYTSYPWCPRPDKKYSS